LNIISQLFGQIINNGLIEGVIQTIALKYVLEGIKKGNGALFIFGTKALEQFKDKLKEYPNYTRSLIEAKQLKNDPLLYEAVYEKYKSIVQSPEDPNNTLLSAAPNPEGLGNNGPLPQQSVFPPLSLIKNDASNGH
jgi:CCR4-NOT transcription complex subunit 1